MLRFEETNRRAVNMNPLVLGMATVWNQKVVRRLSESIRRTRPWIVHFHNTFPLISPACYRAARKYGVAVVQTLHNFRMLCPNGLLFRDQKPCELCIEAHSPWPGIYHRCYRHSASASAAVAAMITVHRVMRTWLDQVDLYIAPSDFTRMKFIEGGLSEDRIVVKPHFLEFDPGIGQGRGSYALYAGRLSDEKGLRTVVEAWKRLPASMALRIAGDGPLAEWLAAECRQVPHIQWLGRQSREQVLHQMKDAMLLVYPSECYETGALAITEAYATGLPVVASNHGTMASVVRHGETGLHFRPGDADHLAEKVRWLYAHPAETMSMRREARSEFENRYSKQANYQALVAIYEAAAARANRGD